MEKRYKRFDNPEINGGDTDSILDMCIKSLSGKVAKYPNTEEGLKNFNQMSLDFFKYCQRVNNDPETEKKIIPDIEAWCTYLGVTRQAIAKYRSERGEEWAESIDKTKTAILSVKKQLMLTGRIPSVVAIFDLSNNHSYVNTTEFKLTPQTENKTVALSASDLPRLDSTNKTIKHESLPILSNDLSKNIVEQYET